MSPVIILPPNIMSEEDMQRLRDNGMCVVVAEDPSQVNFIDPLPCISSRTEIDHAAIKLAQKVLKPETWPDGINSIGYRLCIRLFSGFILETSPIGETPE